MTAVVLHLASVSSLWDTYVLHSEHGNGYQWWSGPGSDLGELTLVIAIITTLVTFYKHHNCEEPGCPRLGHRHPDHGRPVCRIHYHSHEPPKPPPEPPERAYEPLEIQ